MSKRICKTIYFICILVISIFFNIYPSAFSQQTPNYHERFTTEDGLPNDHIKCLLKDHYGYLWIGTKSGLVKYDGNKFTLFDDYDSDGQFIGKVINSLFEDKYGMIWIGTKNGLFCYDRKSMNITKVNLHNKESKAKNKIYKIKQLNDSTILIGAFNGLFLYNPSSNLSSFHPYPDNTGTNFVEIFQYLKNNSALIRLNDFCFEFDLEKRIYNRLSGLENYFLETIFNKNLILYNLQDDYCYKIDETNNLSKFKVKQKISKAHANNNWLYFLYKNSILKYDNNFKLRDRISFDIDMPKNEIFYITCIKEENNGIIWYGSSHGLIKILPKNQFFYFNKNNGLTNNVRSLHIDPSNNLYLGTVGGNSFLVEKIDKSILKKKINDKLIHTIKVPSHSHSTFKILGLPDEKLLFLGTNTIFLYCAKTKKVVSLNRSQKAVYWSAVEQDGDIWAGTSTDPALTKLHIKNNSIVIDTSFEKFGSSETAYTLFKDNLNQIWIGGEGLYKIIKTPKKLFFEEFLPYNDKTTKRKNQIWSNILELDEEHLLIGTRENGLFIINKKTKKHITKINGLLSNDIRSLILDNNKHIWIGTDKGLNYLDFDEKTIYKYTTKEGLISNIFNLKACDKTKDGWIFFGTQNGLVYFHPDSIKNQQIKHSLVIN